MPVSLPGLSHGGVGNPRLTPAQVESALVEASTTGLVADEAGSPDQLLYVGQ